MTHSSSLGGGVHGLDVVLSSNPLTSLDNPMSGSHNRLRPIFDGHSSYFRNSFLH